MNIREEELRKFVAPEFVYGFNARSMVGQYAINFGIRRPLIVTDPGIEEAGWAGQVKNLLDELKLEVTVFNKLTPNPKDFEVHRGVELYKQNRCDGIIAVGGGSPMDCAKGIGIVATNNGSILDYEGVDEVSVPIPPLICIPTTAGTSADVSQFAIITDTDRLTKIAIISKAVVPDVALIDPEITSTMDKELTANTGMDALTHAIEALGSNAGSSITDLHALEASRLVFKYLRKAVNDLIDKSAREGMMRASLQAGLAFSNASLGAVHAMAHSLGGLKDYAHGECNAILLPHVMRYNQDSATEKYARLHEFIGESKNANTVQENCEQVIAAVEELQHDLGVDTPLSNIGLKESDIPALAENAMADPCIVTNPRQASKKDLENLYAQAL